MSRPVRITVTVSADGQIQAETHDAVGEQCLPYVQALEDLLAADTLDSTYTEDWWKTEGAPVVPQPDRAHFAQPARLDHER
ncbi:DUF2997 domain-containing protein [Nocardia noduli]|uniref:DUF2997 domain-containing protein n=1 Tax=Nocardia noduli TaxID=2815722 RepID=UPI001C2255B1|nr:DUF2997 domain-containing protein [Nocardia noduli]